jgi:hypothetical protein
MIFLIFIILIIIDYISSRTSAMRASIANFVLSLEIDLLAAVNRNFISEMRRVVVREKASRLERDFRVMTDNTMLERPTSLRLSYMGDS